MTCSGLSSPRYSPSLPPAAASSECPSLSQNNPPTIVKERVLGLIQYWADAFKGRPQLVVVSEVCEELRSQGVEFPPMDLDQLAPVQTPGRVSAQPSPVALVSGCSQWVWSVGVVISPCSKARLLQPQRNRCTYTRTHKHTQRSNRGSLFPLQLSLASQQAGQARPAHRGQRSRPRGPIGPLKPEQVRQFVLMEGLVVS